MTTWADVINNAIDAAKIIVPAGLTAIVAITSPALVNTFDTHRERKRRQIERIQKAVEDFTQTALAYRHLLTEYYDSQSLLPHDRDKVLISHLEEIDSKTHPQDISAQLYVNGMTDAANEVERFAIVAGRLRTYAKMDRHCPDNEIQEIWSEMGDARKQVLFALRSAFREFEEDGLWIRIRDYFSDL